MRIIDLVGDNSKTKATTVHSVRLAAAPTPATTCEGDSDQTQAFAVPVALALPAVLAGPIVRRATESGVYIWICTSTPVQIEAFAFEATPSIVATFHPDFVPPDKLLGTGTASSQAFGERLHATLLLIAPTGGRFPTQTIISYTMRIMSTRDDFNGEVAFHWDELTYDEKYPSFFFPAERWDLVLLQGSCRKLHGNGADAMKQADRHLRDTARYASQRPQQLLLTGDQIYADDVHPAVLALAQKLGPAIVGFDEVLPLPKGPALASSVAGGRGADQRGGLVRAAGFTSDAGACDNHLMAFSDFMTVYLLGWSGDLWKFAKDNYAKLVGSGSLPDMQLEPACAQRVLANVPTYMMCDDHEVTDDWFIDRPFKEHTENNALLRRVLLNALANYWLFQGWGNNPNEFASRGAGISTYATSGAPANDDTATLERAIARYNWFFVTPPPANVIMMDTRTRRVLFDPPTAPGLLDDTALTDVRSALASAPAGQPAILVSPPPVFGFDGFEFLQKEIVSLSKSDFYEYDYECWSANSRWFFKFLEAIQTSGRRQVVVFAGDVHYSYSASVRYELTYAGAGAVEVLHLTASSMKNKSAGGGPAAATAVAKFINQDRLLTAGKLDGDQYSQFTWKDFTPFSNHGINVYLNWDFHQLQGVSHIVTSNNIGIFRMERGTANPHVQNFYLDEANLYHPGTDASWQTLMTNVQGRLTPSLMPLL